MTKQPEWKFIANLGDVNPLEYGGYFIFEDTTGVYQPEAELYMPEDKLAYRFSLDKLTIWAGHLIPEGFNRRMDLPHPVYDYIEWFDGDIKSIASFVGLSYLELMSMFSSDDICVRARAYQAIGDYHGYDNLDSYPLELTEEEAEKRYSSYLKGE
jgi:hypothetical protein